MKLLFFTNSYPYGFGELWKTNELTVLKDKFSEINVVPFSYGNNTEHIPFIEGIKYHKPLFRNNEIFSPEWRKFIYIFFSKHCLSFLKEAVKEKVFLSSSKFRKWLTESLKIAAICTNKRFRAMIQQLDGDTVVYFYWGRETSEVMGVMRLSCYKTVARFHGYDLYRERNGNYIPYQQMQIRNLDFVLPCSLCGKNALTSYYPQYWNKILVKRLGTITRGKSKASEDGILRIVSCSFLEKVKRVELIAESLKFIDIKIEWVHIGGGKSLDEIRNAVAGIRKNVTVQLPGILSNEAVIDFYNKYPVDLFLNVSESEGVPVSVMEALAAGIPVMATNVGGTSEIVDDNIGKLLPADLSPELLANEIVEFNLLSFEQKLTKRNLSFNRYLEMCNATGLAEDFSEFLLEK